MSSDGTPSRLARRLGTADATLIGLGSMIGAGVFVVFGLAARAAGGWLLIGLLLAAVVASLQCLQLGPAGRAPSDVGRGLRIRPGATWPDVGLSGRMGIHLRQDRQLRCHGPGDRILFGSRLLPRRSPSGASCCSPQSTTSESNEPPERSRYWFHSLSGSCCWWWSAASASDAFDPDSLWDSASNGVTGILQAGALIFFAFAGYARIGTLGEEVRDPARTIPRAMILAVSIALVLYTLVAIAALGTLGADRLASSVSPLAEVTEMAGWPWAGVIVRFAAVVAASGALLTLLAGISRTVFAMAQNRDLPPWLGAVDERRKTPYRAEIVVGLSVMVVLLLTDLLGAVGFSSFLVLWYYAVANLAALRLEANRAPMAPVRLGRGSRGLPGPRSVPLAFHRRWSASGLLVIGWLVRRLGVKRLDASVPT